jgi:hypothetical protein
LPLRSVLILPAILLLVSVIGAGVLVNQSYRREVGRARAAADRARLALEHYSRAIDRLRAGDWTAFGRGSKQCGVCWR